MGTHATTKYRWAYRLDSEEKIVGAFAIPVEEEHLAEGWFKQVIETYLDRSKGEIFDRTRGTLIDYGNDQKFR
ncbi:MAG: hypothetical protein QY322_00515 [bacterium]|nr:MAG: hypothetical protein QY322_00515 [bacterium]